MARGKDGCGGSASSHPACSICECIVCDPCTQCSGSQRKRDSAGDRAHSDSRHQAIQAYNHRHTYRLDATCQSCSFLPTLVPRILPQSKLCRGPRCTSYQLYPDTAHASPRRKRFRDRSACRYTGTRGLGGD
eukprot:04015_2